MTQSKFNEVGYVLNADNTIEEMTYGDYLKNYHSNDQPTSEGVQPRYTVKEDLSGDDPKYHVRKWDVSRFTIVETHDNREDADESCLQSMEDHYRNSNNDAPLFFNNRAEAEQTQSDRS
ncbi:MAG: hypothetical protein JNM00_09165 [Flavobacteriales bacterium]|nr:hypothetical protein [Flavobacteriales bacterium]